MSEKSPHSSRDLEATQIINMANNNETIPCQVEAIPLSEEELKQKITQPDWSKLKSSFTNLSVLGFGGMGTVFKAKDTLFYRNLALKVMRSDLKNDKKSIESFIREARITAQIDHPNIIPVYNLGIFEGTGAYFSMKKVDGETLEHILRKLEARDPEYMKKYSISRRVNIFLNICNGMLFAHSKGIIHRDLKPANIMIGNYGEVFIMDWGMAIYIAKNDSSSHKEKIDLREDDTEEKKNIISGTPLFMSPEQIAGKERKYGEQSDVYALGNILYCLLCCVPTPHDPKLETRELFSKIINGEIVRPHKRSKHLKISRELEAIAMKALEVNRHRRYKNVAELMNDIKNYLDLQVVGVYNSPIIRFFKFCRRHPLIPTTLTAALLTIGVVFSYLHIKDWIELSSLKKNLTQNIEEAVATMNKQFQLINRMSNSTAATDIECLKLNVISNTTTLINENRLFYNFHELFDTLHKIEMLNINTDITVEKEQILKLVIDYCFNNINDELTLQKILSHCSTTLADELNVLTRENPEIGKKISLLQANKGKIFLNQNNNTPLSCVITCQNNPDMEPILINAPCELELSADTYLFSYKNQNMDTISIPIKIDAGHMIYHDFDIEENFPHNMIFIPGGEYFSRITNLSDLGIKRNIDSFFISRNEVTFGEYLEFWNTIKDENLRKKYTAKHIKMTQNGIDFVPLWDNNGSLISPLTSELPISGLNLQAIEAYCQYLSKKLNKKCRLPYFGEIEKAARGVDKRLYVWGNEFMPDLALLNSSSSKSDYPYGAPANVYPNDISVYGVKNLAGNLRELIKISGSDDYGIYGGSYSTDNAYAKCSSVNRFNGALNDIGFRYVIEMDNKK